MKPTLQLPRSLLCLVLMVVGAAVPNAWAQLPLAVGGEPLPSLAPMIERVTPAVVNIATVNQIDLSGHPLLRDPVFRWFFDLPNHRKPRKSQSLGSGVVVDARKGLVLTNQHVVAGADEIEVTLVGGQTLRATLVGSDPETDVAVLRIPAESLSDIPLADSDRLRVGDFVVAIGNPFGLKQSVTSGIVSALGRSGLGIEGYENFIQTDASINPGNSGGPLVNLRGELVGINTAILAPGGGNIGIGFAIPVNMARAVMNQLLEHGEIRRGTFGAATQDLDAELARALGVKGQEGAVVIEVEPGSAAARAGLRVGDVVVALNGIPVHNASDLRNQVGLVRIGGRIDMEVIRDGKRSRLSGEVADPYAGFVAGNNISPYFEGATLGEGATPAGKRRSSRVAVGPVKRDSNAWNLGVREGDLILEINRTTIQELADLKRALRGNELYRVKVQRGDELILLSRR